MGQYVTFRSQRTSELYPGSRLLLMTRGRYHRGTSLVFPLTCPDVMNFHQKGHSFHIHMPDIYSASLRTGLPSSDRPGPGALFVPFIAAGIVIDRDPDDDDITKPPRR